MAKFVKVVNGHVEICNEYNAKLKEIYPNGGALYADIHPRTEEILVVTPSYVILYDKNGGNILSFSANGNVAIARWMGDDVFIQHQNGSCELRSRNGGWIKPL